MMKLTKLIMLTAWLMTLAILQSCSENLNDKSVAQLLNRGSELACQGEWQSALKYAKASVKREPENAVAQVLMALVYENNNNIEQALQAARLAAKAEPKYFLAQYTFGRLCLKVPAKIQDSIEPLKRALQLKPGDVDTLILLARGAKKLGLLDTMNYFKQLAASKRYAGRSEPFNEMGILYAEQNNYRSAARCFVTAYNRSPDNPIVTLNLAIFMDYYGKQLPARTVKYYRKFLNQVKDNSVYATQAAQVRKRIHALVTPQ